MLRYSSFLAAIAGLLFSAGCGSDPPDPNGSEPAPADQSTTGPEPAPEVEPAVHPAVQAEAIRLYDQARTLMYEGRRAEWAAASEAERLRACLLFSMTKSHGLDDYGHGIMSQRFANTVDDYYQQIGDNEKVIEILALTLVLDGQEWLEELGGEAIESKID